jgi:hypothetical protein
MGSLWPDDLPSQTQKPPRVLLLEQALHLKKQTNSKLTADVVKRTVTQPVPATFNYSFVLVAPALGNYSFSLINFDHPVELYPVKIIVDDKMKASLPALFPKERTIMAKNEEEFLKIVQEIFNSERTRKIISGLLSQSGGN